MPVQPAAGAREALENGKGAQEARNFEAAHRHYDRAVRLCGAGDEMVRAEATYLRGALLFTESKYVECLPYLRAYLEQDTADALSFCDTAKSFLAIAEMEADPSATTMDAVIAAADATSDDARRRSASPSYQVDYNPAHQYASTTEATDLDESSDGQRFDGRLSGGRLRTSNGRTYSAPEPAGEPFERDARGRGRGLSRSLQTKCVGEAPEDRCLCCWSMFMASLALLMWLYGIVA
jgi:tetratricopeptide (TPR) repeat protein